MMFWIGLILIVGFLSVINEIRMTRNTTEYWLTRLCDLQDEPLDGTDK